MRLRGSGRRRSARIARIELDSSNLYIPHTGGFISIYACLRPVPQAGLPSALPRNPAADESPGSSAFGGGDQGSRPTGSSPVRPGANGGAEAIQAFRKHVFSANSPRAGPETPSVG
jgi:hypothetical protein